MKKLVAGNWKMNLLPSQVSDYSKSFLAEVGKLDGVDLLLCPSDTALPAAVEAFRNSRVRVGAQNMHSTRSGAFTGETSGEMLADIGVTHVLLGHSERRHVFGEDDELIYAKLVLAHKLGLKPILCVGEKQEQRESGSTEQVLREQFEGSLGRVSNELLAATIVAYEPVWAIGTGLTATPEIAQQAHRFLRSLLGEKLGEAASTVPILYGGSVKPANAAELMSQPDIDGVLVGGASLKPDSFAAIAKATL
ncbi:triose-phosphate isomerase [bacterium]|nr:triose-phosphate isomerase [bacterium]